MIDYDVSDGVCVLRLNSPPLNTISFSLLEELRDSIGRANSDPQVRGIIITGDAGHFSAGADVRIFKEIKGEEDAIRTSRLFQKAFGEVEDSRKPVAAAVAGKVMGSALELAMSCHFRVCAKQTRFSMPEVTLGINPGAGGTQRLPRLIGAEKALEMLLTGESMDAEKALALGLVDSVCEGDELVERAGAMLQSRVARDHRPLKTRERAEKIRDSGVNDAAFLKAGDLLASVRPEIIAPLKIVEAVKAGLADSFDAGLRKEQEAFAECMATSATQNKIYLFFATRETSKVPDLADVEPADITKAAVIGMGTMGTGITQAFMMGGIPVTVLDEDETALQRGMSRITASFRKRADQGKLPPDRLEDTLGLLSTTTKWQEIADADFVIEAVFEDIGAKRSVIRAVEEASASSAIIATNTSTISLDALAEGMRQPERLIGMHFFNPPHYMPLVEIIRRSATSKSVIATAMKFARTIRKTPVLVNNREGFLVNRIFVPYFKEAFWLLEEGAEAPAIDAAMVEFGFPMGPLVLIDMAGIDILAHVDALMRRAFRVHGPLSAVAIRLVERRHLGQKTGAGVYKYGKDDYTPHHNEATDEIIAQVQREAGRAPRKIDRDEITQRLVLRMVNEAFCVMEEGIALRTSDVDAAMVLGTGFPDFRGGVLKYAHDLGLANVLAQLEELTQKFGGRFSPCQLLREMKAGSYHKAKEF